MLSHPDVDDLRMNMAGVAPVPTDEESFDYRQALQTAIDIDDALTLDLAALESGTIEASVAQEYKPWAGAWWPLKGELVFGYEDRPTFSDEIREQVDPIKNEMDALSEEIREMKDDDETPAEDEAAPR